MALLDGVHTTDPLPEVWDPQRRIGDMLRGKRGLVVGVANEHSIAFGCASKLRAFGADIALTYLNEKSERYVRPLAVSCFLARVRGKVHRAPTFGDAELIGSC